MSIYIPTYQLLKMAQSGKHSFHFSIPSVLLYWLWSIKVKYPCFINIDNKRLSIVTNVQKLYRFHLQLPTAVQDWAETEILGVGTGLASLYNH